MEIKQLYQSTYIIETPLSLIPFYKINEKQIILLDTGWAEGERDGLLEVLKVAGLEVVAAFCTHAHIDHAGNALTLRDVFGAQLIMPEFEAMLLSSPHWLKVYYQGMGVDKVKTHYGHMIMTVDRPIKPNENRITICDVDFEIFHTKGHSPDHIAIRTPDDVVYLGDALVSEKVLKSSKLPYAFILSQAMTTMQELKALKATYYIVSHHDVYTEIETLVDINLAYYHDKALAVLDFVDSPKTVEQLMQEVSSAWHIGVKSVDKFLVVEKMLRSYVEYLSEKGFVEAFIDQGYLKYKRSGSL